MSAWDETSTARPDTAPRVDETVDQTYWTRRVENTRAGSITDSQQRFLSLDPPRTPGRLGQLGPYEVIRQIGEGGMGLVFEGFEPALDRSVAIKVLAPELAISPTAHPRFAREARAAASVRHEHVIEIYAVDHIGSLPYLVMPYISGPSLQVKIKQGGPMPLEECLRIGMQVALGLAAAHAKGLVHRDIKPANILLDGGVRALITDFGLARPVDDLSLTRSGVVTGTPAYMSPEQAQGKRVDNRSDLFSLGSVLYVMCTGQVPFRASSSMEVLWQIIKESPRPIREINPGIPNWLAEIVEKLHAKDPGGRFQSAIELAELLGRWLAEVQQLGRSTLTRDISKFGAAHAIPSIAGRRGGGH